MPNGGPMSESLPSGPVRNRARPQGHRPPFKFHAGCRHEPLAYVPMHGLRRLGLKGTELERAQATTIRLRLLKVGAQIRISVRKVWLSMAPSYPLQRLFGHQYVLRARLREAAVRLAAQPNKVLDIALDCGFGDVSNFNRAFRAEFGVSPRVYRRQTCCSGCGGAAVGRAPR